ncbi:MAG: hypothetical protein JWL90_2834, partial [Chthoniobacteraceae bacterium]|nr:hypothetical protein [Chthoniobacteraceae bacterium]
MKNSRTRAFTLVELSISTSIACLVGIILYVVAWNGMILYAKNTAINS